MDCLLPTEIITNILEYMSITDLVRVERTCRLFQSFALCEIEKRIIKSGTTRDEWGILIHLGQVDATPVRFDSKTKKAYYSILMDPVKIKTMFDHRRSIHCSLLRKNSGCSNVSPANQQQRPNNIQYQSYSEEGFIITVEKGMKEGKTVQLDVENESCQVNASLTLLPVHHTITTLAKTFQPIKLMAPPPLTYTLQITELSLPLSTIAT